MQNHSGKAALLVMDLQNGFVTSFAENGKVPLQIQNALASARAHSIPVIFTRVGFSGGYPEINPRNKNFARVAEMGGMKISDEATQIHPSVKPEGNEPLSQNIG